MANLKMPQLNTVQLSGRLARDAEIKYTSTGKAMLKNAIAVDQGFGDKKTTEFYNIKAWEKVAERIEPLVRKGTPVIISGRLTMERWENREGVVIEKPCIDVYQMYALEWHDDNGGSQKAAPQATQDAHSEAKSNGYAPPQPEDDLPF